MKEGKEILDKKLGMRLLLVAERNTARPFS